MRTITVRGIGIGIGSPCAVDPRTHYSLMQPATDSMSTMYLWGECIAQCAIQHATRLPPRRQCSNRGLNGRVPPVSRSAWPAAWHLVQGAWRRPRVSISAVSTMHRPRASRSSRRSCAHAGCILVRYVACRMLLEAGTQRIPATVASYHRDEGECECGSAR
jgi:hypothetical protein